MFALIARAADRPPPRVRLPYPAVGGLARIAVANGHEIELARLPAWSSSAKARRDLGYRPAPIEPAVERAVGSLGRRRA